MKKETEFENWINLIKSSEQGSYQLACLIVNKDLRKEFKETYGISFLYYKIEVIRHFWWRGTHNVLEFYHPNLLDYLRANDIFFTRKNIVQIQRFKDLGRKPTIFEICEYFGDFRISIAYLRQKIYSEWHIFKNLKSKPSNQLTINYN